MKSLNAFVNPLRVENQHIVVSKRFIEDGEPITWEIKAISQAENESIAKRHIKRDKKGIETFNRTEYVAELTASAIVFPDLKNAELQKHYGVMGEAQLLKKMLHVGEYAELVEKVQELSGLDRDEDLIEEAKN